MDRVLDPQQDEVWMEEALKEAQKAYKLKEVPVGAILESRLTRVVYGALDPYQEQKERLFLKTEETLNSSNFKLKQAHSEVFVTKGVLESQCSESVKAVF